MVIPSVCQWMCHLATGWIPETPDRCVENWRCLGRASIAIVRPDPGLPLLKDAAVVSTCSSRDLLSTRNGSERTVTVPKRGNEFSGRRAEFRDPDPSLFSWPCPLISLLIYIAACLHAGHYSKRFPELFTSQLVNSVALLFISAVIDSTIHIFFFFLFFRFLRSPFSVLRAERPSVIRARPPAVNVARSWKKNIPPCSGIREQKLGSLAVVHDGNTVSSWQFTGLTTRLREPRFAATCVSSRFHFVLFRGRKSSALNFKRDISIEWIWCLSVVVFAQFTSEYTL